MSKTLTHKMLGRARSAASIEGRHILAFILLVLQGAGRR